MDVELVTECVSDEDTFEVDENNDVYTTFEGEDEGDRCGICMDVVIDRGVLDCCQHWFCFTCIDNWATITNLCPLCQNEFQLITCVPVYDTIGSSKVDDDYFSRDDEWCIEGKNNTLSFPSYYIDENAVICLGGDGCKIQNGSATTEEDSNLDTSIACDSCDIWYHAFCVGFDPEGSCENSWLCPRCVDSENVQKSNETPASRSSNQCAVQNVSSECLVEAAFSGKVSVSVADAGETAVVISMIEGNQGTAGPSEKCSSMGEVSKDLNVETLVSNSSANSYKLETPSSEKSTIQSNLEAQELGLYLSRDTSFSLPSQNASSECLVQAAFSGKVSVSVADAGETAVLVSMIEGNQGTEGPSEKCPSIGEVSKDPNIETLVSSSTANNSKLETLSSEKSTIQSNLEAQELVLSLSRDASFSLPSISSGLSELKTNSSDKAMNEPSVFDGVGISSQKLFDEACESSVDLHLGLSVGSSLSVDHVNNDVAEDQVAGDAQQNSISEECLLPAGKVAPDTKGNVVEIAGAKRKRRDYCGDVHTAPVDGETKAIIETKVLAKKVRAERNSQMIQLKDQADEPVSDDSQKCSSLIVASGDNQLRGNSEKGNVSSNIMSIVRGTDRRSFKGLAAGKPSKESENAAGLRVKKILRRAAEDKESSMLVQNLRKEIREAVRNKSSKDIGENLFDPKLLAAFRVAVAGPITEPAKKLPPLVVKAKKPMLQKGKIRENLTKKIYGIGGRRRRAWTRDCEIEFWKHRCLKVTKPEKIETLKSVLDLLRKSSDRTEMKQGTAGEATNSILSRLYLADTSVFPRKDDIKPLSAFKCTGNTEESKEHTSMVKASMPSLGNHTVKTPETNKVSSKVGVPLFNNSGNKSANVPGLKREAASIKVHRNRCPEGSSISSLGGSKVNSQKEKIVKSDDVKNDKRKWALEVLARKMAVTGRNAQEKQDNALLKGNYPLLAQLPIDMRPVLAPSRHNKIPVSVRQAQLYRLTEHFLRKTNLPVTHRTADTELAVADAVNIEKEVADRSSSKLVYVNLCSQELLHRSDNINSSSATESDPSPNSAPPTDEPEQAINDLSDGPVVEALRNAGLLSDSPPNSPYHQIEEINDEDDPSKNVEEEGPDNVFEMDSHPDLDIYGDFEYNLEDEDFVGASSLKISKLQPEGESQIKVVFSTLNSDRSNNALDLEDHERTMIVEVPKGSSGLHEVDTDTSIRSLTVEGRTESTDRCLPPDPLPDKGGEEPSLAECEELYGPDKEPLISKFLEGASMLNSSGIENSPNHPQTNEDVQKEKISNRDTEKQSDYCNSVAKKVEAYIKEHIRPLCKSGVITVEQYRWTVGKTTDKVMKYHRKDKNANFLIKEGEKVKKLAEKYVETAQQMEKS
ncbi:hypothetical protein F0562_035526 [Nyssa sinensis]|uniref:RING-type domain-containing protein n=1 Tax=Nyssa sinensis TaxID=561372 RepID=A0A5J5ABC9_9ASTE|nr:hypothetical protein F0562_035526 [Nyssa sinensis]